MHTTTKEKLPKGELQRLSEKHELNYVKASRLSAGMVNPSSLRDYEFMKDLKDLRDTLAEARKNFQEKTA
jgi:hypothetical protein